MWAHGQATHNEYGVVPTWTGICHGWAAATQVGLPQPEKAVEFMDVTKSYIVRLYPFDIQALMSYLWSRAQVDDLFTVRRCRINNPSTDPDGRITEPACFDVNPMTWHLAVTNRAGMAKKSFVMDTTFDSEVWNYALDSYQVSYFNPMTMEFSFNPLVSIASLSDFPHDPYAKYRGEKATHIVGVVMDVFHPGAIAPHTGLPSDNFLERKQLIYDLELNSQYEVVGGEWYTKDHPDFIWLYPQKYNPFISPEVSSLLSYVDSDSTIPEDLALKALAYSENGRLLPELVYKFLHKSLIITQ